MCLQAFCYHMNCVFWVVGSLRCQRKFRIMIAVVCPTVQLLGTAVNSLCIILAAESSGKLSPSSNKNLSFGGNLSKTLTLVSFSKFSKILMALSDSSLFIILITDSIDNN